MSQSEQISHSIKSHQLYFIQRWGELVSNSPMDYRKLLKPCSRAVLNEAIRVIEYYKSQILYQHNVVDILEDCFDNLSSDLILKHFFKDDFDLVLDILNKFIADKKTFIESEEGFKKLQKLEVPAMVLKALFNKLENADVPHLYSIFLIEELNKDYVSFETIDEYLCLLVSELLYEGHQKQYLEYWCRVILYNKDVKFFEKIERISYLGKKNIQKFTCYITLNLPEGCDNFIYTAQNGDIKFYKNPKEIGQGLVDSCHIEVQDKEKFINYFDTDKKLAKIDIFAVDQLSSINKAREKLIKIANLFTLENSYRLYNMGNITEGVVHNLENNKLSYVNLIDQYQEGLFISDIETYINISLCNQLTHKYQGLEQILQWCSVVQDSPRETGLVAMWSMMEYLFVSDYHNKRQDVITYCIPFVGLFYMKRILYKCREVLKRFKEGHALLIQEVEKTYGYNAIDRKNKEIKLHYLLHMISDKYKFIEEIYRDRVFALRQVGLIHKFLLKRGKKLWFLDYLLNLEKQVEKDLIRAYRIRNILAHQGLAEDDFFEDIYEKMLFYLKIILDDLLYSMKLQPEHTIQQLVCVKKETYSVYKKMISNPLDDNIQLYKKLLQTRSILV